MQWAVSAVYLSTENFTDSEAGLEKLGAICMQLIAGRSQL